MGDDFYVEDEPIEEVVAAWEAGEKGITTQVALDGDALMLLLEASTRLGISPSELLRQAINRYVAS